MPTSTRTLTSPSKVPQAPSPFPESMRTEDGENFKHPWANSKNLIEVLPNDGVDLEEESRRFEEMVEWVQDDSDVGPGSSSSSADTTPTQSRFTTITRDPNFDFNANTKTNIDPVSDVVTSTNVKPPPSHPNKHKSRTSSIFSRQSIWLEDRSGDSLAFARGVEVTGWTNVGDNYKLQGAYIVYDCAIKTKEGTIIHAHKRYSHFIQLEQSLRQYLPRHLLHFIPPLPPKAPLARYRPAFLDKRRRELQFWLASVLLHPDIGASAPVRRWVME